MTKRPPANFRFTPGEFVGSVGDLGTLLPLMIGLIAFSHIGAGSTIMLVGATYIFIGLYYRLPVPVQPLKATAMIAIATGATGGEIRAAAFWMAGIMLILGVTKLAEKLNDAFPRFLVSGLQFSLGLMMIRSATQFILSYPDSLSALVLKAHGTPRLAQSTADLFPSGAEFWSALVLLVLPQIPLTLGNSVLATRDCALRYFGKAGERVTIRRLAMTIGLGNLAAGVVGGMPVCHGAGGMTAHYHFGARSGVAGLALGVLLFTAGVVGGHSSASMLSMLPAWLLGVPLAYAGLRHATLARDSFKLPETAVAVVSMGAVGYITGNLLEALFAGFAIKYVVQGAVAWMRGVQKSPPRGQLDEKI